MNDGLKRFIAGVLIGADYVAVILAGAVLVAAIAGWNPNP